MSQTPIYGTNSFNPRARMGRDPCANKCDEYRYVSTHAPAWGATALRVVLAGLQGVSTHAPAWGATSTSPSKTQLTQCFNPRARMGRDRLIVLIILLMKSFNPRARMGRDS